jgi:hypothetical protein
VAFSNEDSFLGLKEDPTKLNETAKKPKEEKKQKKNKKKKQKKKKKTKRKRHEFLTPSPLSLSDEDISTKKSPCFCKKKAAVCRKIAGGPVSSGGNKSSQRPPLQSYRVLSVPFLGKIRT